MAARNGRCPIFRECIERHFKTWSSLQLSLREVMPGPVSKEFFAWLLGTTETFFYENDDLYPDEVSDFLAEILNTELDTLIEDGSLELVCGALCKAFRACATGRQAEVTAELAKLPAPADLATCRQAPAMDAEDDDAAASGPAPAAAAAPGPSTSASEPAAPEGMQTEDGWTVVAKKRR